MNAKQEEFSEKTVFHLSAAIKLADLLQENTPVIEKIYDRKSAIIRPPLANLDVLVFVVSTCEPQPNLLLLDKFIAVAEHKGIKPIIVFTTIDKQDFKPFTKIYKKCGIDVFEDDNISGYGSENVKNALQNKISAFLQEIQE